MRAIRLQALKPVLLVQVDLILRKRGVDRDIRHQGQQLGEILGQRASSHGQCIGAGRGAKRAAKGIGIFGDLLRRAGLGALVE